MTSVTGLPTGAGFSSDCITANSVGGAAFTLTISTNAVTTPAGTTNFHAAPDDVQQRTSACSGTQNDTGNATTGSLTVQSAGPTDQTITFDPIADKSYDPTLAVPLSATATSGLTVTFSSLTLGVCTVSGANAILGDGLGTCTIKADQAGDG